MAELTAVKRDIAEAVSAAGWRTHAGFSTDYAFPFVVVAFDNVAYMETYNGKMVIDVEIIIYASVSDIAASQRLVDAAMSFGTDTSIPSALIDGSYTTISSAQILEANRFETVVVNESPVAYTATLNLKVTTN